jgi:hypothetical protein
MVRRALGLRLKDLPVAARVVRKNSIRAIGAEYEHEGHGMMSA